MRQLLTFCESRASWALDTLTTLVECESPSTDKAAVDRCANLVAQVLHHAGATVETLPCATAGNMVLAEFGSPEPRRACPERAASGRSRRVLLLGHLDTVWPVGQLETMPLRRDGNRLYGPGVLDMKAGVVIGILAAMASADAGDGRSAAVSMLLTGDEETGSGESRAVIEREARRADAVFVLEPSLPGGAVKTSRKGTGDFELSVRGVEAHAGIEPEKGVSAILELADQIQAVDRLQAPGLGTTLNVGVVSGGRRPNVVAGEASALIDVRVTTAAEASRVEAALAKLSARRPGGAVTVSGGFDRPPLERTAAVASLFALAREAARELGFELEEGGTGGASDGNFTAALGVPTLDGLGADGAGAHAAHEHIVVAALPFRAALVAGLLQRVEDLKIDR
ncbi:MAG: M20 family peptidase [Acidobacteria bacterium]|nr:MAG: M20 family peptidase [Acidobacteriota bacterium]